MNHPRRRLALLVGLLFLLAIQPLIRQPLTAQGDPAAEIFQRVNQVRMSHGLPPFTYNGQLAAAAQSHANWMAANVAYTHTGAGGSTPLSRAQAQGFQGYVSENIVGGTNMSPRGGVLWWQNSPVHYATITSGRYTEAGTGYATNGEQNMYVLVVGRPSGTAPVPRAVNEGPQPIYVEPIQLAEPREDGAIVHQVGQGQALWTISAYYDVELAELYLINNLNENAVIKPGDEIFVRLPDGVAPPPTPTPPLTHTVREGENVWSIAARNDISMETLMLLNSLTSDSVLRPGDVLKVRLAAGEAPPPTPTPRTTHVVRSGDSAWSIAAAYGLTVDRLLAINELAADAVLRPGDELMIREPTPTAPAPQVTATTEPSTTLTSTAAIAPTPAAVAVTQAEQPPPNASPSPSTNLAAQAAAPPEAGNFGLFVLGGGLILIVGAILVIARQQAKP